MSRLTVWPLFAFVILAVAIGAAAHLFLQALLI
jgi:hypothetical protein